MKPTYEELEQQLAESHRALRAETTAHDHVKMHLEKMAAENVGLKEYLAPVGLAVEGTPATDAFLAEVRAQCLNAFIQHHSAELDAHIKNGGEQFDEKSVRIRDIIVSARLFREQIRKGVQS